MFKYHRILKFTTYVEYDKPHLRDLLGCGA